MEFSHEQMNLLLDNIAEAIIVINAGDRIVFMNKAAEKMFGYRVEELSGQPVDALIPQRFLALYHQHVQDLATAPEPERKMECRRELYARRKDGTEFPLEIGISKAGKDGDEFYTAMVTDITERKHAEETLRGSEEHMQALIKNSIDGITLIAADGTILYDSPSVSRILGYTTAERVTRKVFEFMHPDERRSAEEKFTQFAQNLGATEQSEGRFLAKDGAWCWIEGVRTNLLNEPGVNAIVVNYRDITERKQAEEVAAEESNLLNTLSNSLPDAIYFKDMESRFIRVNQAQARQFGLSDPAQAIGKTDFDFFTEEHAQPAYEDEQVIIRSGQPLVAKEEKETWPNGRTEWVSTTKMPLRDQAGRIVGTFGISRKVTERKQAEDALAAERNLLRSLIDNVPDYVYVKDNESRFVTANPALARLIGVATLDELVGKRDYDFFPQELAAQYYAREQTLFQSGQPLLDYEEFLVDTAGHPRWVSTTKVPLRDAHGKSFGLVGMGRDITERKRAEQAQLESNAKFRALFESSPDAIMLIDPHDNWPILDCNTAACRMNGYVRDELVGQSIDIVNISPGSPSERVEYLEQIRQKDVLRMETLHRRKDGIIFPIETSTSMITLDGRKVLLGIDRDITERKRAAEALASERNLLRTLMDNLPSYVYIKDTEGRYVINNVMHTRFLGKTTPDEVVGKTVYDLFSREIAEEYDVDDQMVIQSGQPVVNREEPSLDPVGNPIWNLTTKVPLRDLQGKVYGLVAISHDVTDRKQREHELEAIATVSAALRAAQTLEEMLPLLLDSTLGVIRATHGAIWLYDPDKDELRTVVTRGWDQETLDHRLPPEKPGEGINGYVLATGLPYVASDFHLDLRLSETVRQWIPPGMGGAAVPIRAGDNVIGTFDINVSLPREVTPGELNLLNTLGEIAGNAIQRTRLHEKTQRDAQRLAALHLIDVAISANVELRTTLNILLGQVIGLLKVSAADVLLFNPLTLAVEYSAGQGFRSGAIEKSQLRLGEGYAGRAALERRTINVPDLRSVGSEHARKRLLTGEEFVAYFGVPLITKGKVIGVLDIFNRSPLTPDSEWLNFMESLASQAAIAIDNATLFNDLQRSNIELASAYDTTIEGWSHALDLRDRETEGHTQRVTDMTVQLARTFGVGEAELVQVRWGALLHDIGKMGVPDGILFKPGPLTETEWVIMKKHPVFAQEMLAPIRYLEAALDIPYNHHEKWDGTGYPRGLKGEQIPLTARIFAVVDVWDALCSDRPYRAAWPKEKVHEHIRSRAGSHFEPRVVEVFLKLMEKV